MLSLLNDLKKYNSKNSGKIKSREQTLINAERLHNNRNNIIKAFEDRFFAFIDGFKKKTRFPNRGNPISLHQSHRLIQDIEQGETSYEEALKRITSIRNDIKRIDNLNEFNQTKLVCCMLFLC